MEEEIITELTQSVRRQIKNNEGMMDILEAESLKLHQVRMRMLTHQSILDQCLQRIAALEQQLQEIKHEKDTGHHLQHRG